MRLGIDFGTTRTVVAWSDRGNYPVVTFNDGAGDAVEWFPSVVAERDGELRFAFDALTVAGDSSWSVARSFKRLLSGPEASSDGTLLVGSTRLSVHELLLRFLTALRAALRTRSNLPKRAREQERFETVIATPANAFCTQRFLTLEAFRRAGFDVRRMLNEPSAAGFEYSHRHGRTLNSKREHVVVYDLGGGTFDASLVRMSGKQHDAVVTAGVSRLGGDDFDRVLASLVLERAKVSEKELVPGSFARLIEQCREAKEKLNPNSRKLNIDLEQSLGAQAKTSELVLPVSDYFDACTPLVEKTLEAMKPVIERLDGEVPREEEDVLADIAGIYVVGGASALPVIGRVLRSRFGRRVHRSPYPHAAVAIGLAIAADEGAGFELSDRFSRNFGVFREAQGGTKASYDPIFKRDMTLPRAGEAPVSIRRRYRAAHDVGHFRFFECAGFDEEGVPQGELAPMTEVFFAFDPALRKTEVDLTKWPVRRLPGLGVLIEERYTVDANGMVQFTITEVDSGYERTHQLGA